MTYVNAGHNPPMLFRPHKRDTRLPIKAAARPFAAAQTMAGANADACEMIRLETGGMVIGLLPDAEYQHETVQLQPGDVLVIYSDGISEAMNMQEEEFGEPRLARLIAAHLHLPPTDLRDRVLAEIAGFVREAPQHDDMTLVVGKVS